MLTYIFVSNIIVFLLYGIDKYRAVHGQYRISEKTLLILPFLLSSLGAMLGMIIFNHKTSKIKFRILIPLSFLENAVIYYLFMFLQ